MKMKLVLCWLMVVALTSGCSTVYEAQVERSRKITGERVCPDYRTVKIVLPLQRGGNPPFTLHRGKSIEFLSKESVARSKMIAPYLGTVAPSDNLPIRCREGFILKRAGKWYLLRFRARMPAFDCYIAEVAQRGG